jgi:methyltransferase-like protein
LRVICTQPHDAERDKLAEELAGLRGDVKALKSERDETGERNRLRDQIAELKREKATLTEESSRKIRETEHKTGLLKTKQEHDVEHARRMAVLEVREAGLKADRERFEAEMKFQREHFDQRADQQDGILKAILERLPAIDVALSGSAAPRPAPRKAAD